MLTVTGLYKDINPIRISLKNQKIQYKIKKLDEKTWSINWKNF